MPGYPDNFPFHRTHIHRPERTDRRGTPTFFWPAVLLLASGTVALVCWGAYNYLPKAIGAEKYLRAAAFSPKVNWDLTPDEGGEPELLPVPQAVEEALPMVVANATAEPPLLPATVELPPPVLQTVEAPAPKPVFLAAPKPMFVEPPPPEVKIELPSIPLPPPPLVEAPPPVELPELLPYPAVVHAFPPPLEELPMPAVIVAVPALPEPPSVIVAPVFVPPDPPARPQVVEFPSTQPLVYCDVLPGDTPMIRNWKTLSLFSLFTTVVLVQAPPPVAAQDTKTLDAIESLKKSVEEAFKTARADMQLLSTSMQSLKDELNKIQDDAFDQRLKTSNAVMKMQEVEKSLVKIKDDLDDLKTKISLGGSVRAAGIDKGSVDEIKLKLGAIEQAILKLQPSTTTTDRVALSPPGATGKVLLMNLYSQDLLFVVNQKAYRVGPNSTMTIDNVSAGAVLYELISDLWGSRGRATTTLNPNETLTLTAR